jgi:hypothetical protein
MTGLAAHGALVIAPSPLEGEGTGEFPRVMMGEGSAPFDTPYPSPISAVWHIHRALSLKGRGHSNGRRVLGPLCHGARA